MGLKLKLKRIHKFFALIIILFFNINFVAFANPQNKNIDSLINITLLGNSCEKSSAYCDLSFYYLDSTGYRSKNFANKALYFAKKCNNNKDIAFAYIMIGSTELAKSNYKEAIENFKNAENFAIIDTNYYQLHTIYNNLGVIYKSTENYELALNYYSKALDYAYLANDTQSIIQSLTNIANIYTLENKQIKALEYYKKAIEVCQKEDKSFEIELASIFNNIAYIYLTNKNYSEAEKYYQKAFNIFLNNKFNYGIAVMYANLAELKFSLKQYSEAEKYIILADSVNSLIDSKESKKNLYFNAYQLYKKTGIYDKALNYLEKYTTLKDSIFTIELNESIENIRAQYELNKINSELIYQKNILQQKKKTEKFYRISSIFSILIIALLVYIIINKIQSYNKLNKLNNKLNTALAEIDDNIEYSKKILNTVSENSNKNFDYTYFVLDKPKMKVGGDFYYFEKSHNSNYFIVADCTGHGVSAAFLSLISINIIKECIKNNDYPKDILNKLNKRFNNYFTRNNNSSESLAISVIKIFENYLEFSGSKQRIWIHENISNEIVEYKSDKIIIGYDYFYNFNEERIPIKKGDTVYLSSDGFPDQFNYDNSKKFRYDNFKNTIQKCSSINFGEAQKIFLEEVLFKWKGENEQTDDILVAGIKI